MPEIIEVELYRRALEPIIGRRISRVVAPDPWFVKGGVDADGLAGALVGTTVVALRRRGKLLLVDVHAGQPRLVTGAGSLRVGAEAVIDADEAATDADAVLGVRFGMTGRPVLDDGEPIMSLLYSSRRFDVAWDRFALEFADGGAVRLNDPRRLGGVELDPDEGRLGPDAFTIGLAAVRRALQSRSAVKAVLLDQSRIAGIGNLLGDEILWEAGIDPARPASSLDEKQVAMLHRTLRRVLRRQLALGGSHTGRLATGVREVGPICPREGALLVRRTIGGRTTRSCPVHQR